MWLGLVEPPPEVGKQKPTAVSGGGFLRKDFSGKSASLTTAPGLGPDGKTGRHRALARDGSFGSGNEMKVHQGARSLARMRARVNPPSRREAFLAQTSGPRKIPAQPADRVKKGHDESPCPVFP